MIKQIRIQNFKSLRDVTVSLDPVTVLIGRSGTGKSNFVNAIRALRDYLTHRNNATFADQNHISAAGTAMSQFSFSVIFDIRGVPGDFNYELTINRSPIVFSESLSIGGRQLFHQREGKWVTPPDLARVPGAGQVALGVLYGIPEVKIAHLALTKGLGCYDFPGTVLTAGQNSASTESNLNDSAQNYLAAFDAVTSNLSELTSGKEITAALRKLNSSVASVELETMNRSHIVVGHRLGNGKILAFNLAIESEGFRRFLAHLIALYQTPPKQTLVFEEPEKGIFPGALAVLADYFKSCAERGRSQVILTTHSPQLLSHFSPEQIRVVELEGYETKIGKVSKEQLEALREHLLTTEELLTVDTARLDPATTGG